MDAPPSAEDTERLRVDCRNRALMAFGTARVFRERMRRYRFGLRLIKFFNFGTPLATGAAILSFGGSGPLFAYAKGAAGVLLLLNIVVALWSEIMDWQAKYDYARRSADMNTRLRYAYDRLATASGVELHRRYYQLESDDIALETDDEGQDLTLTERRFGMRAALYEYQRACATCRLVPLTIVPATDCSTCGRFKLTPWGDVWQRRLKP